MSRSVAALGLALALSSCDPGAAYRSASSTLWLDADTLYVTSPDDDAVVALDAITLEERWRVEVAGAPAQLAQVEGSLLVTLASAAEVAWIDLGTREVRRSPVPCGGTRAAVADGRGGALVSCPHDDLVLGLTEAGVAWQLDAPGRPTALAVRGERFAVTASRTGELHLGSLDARAIDETRALVTERGFAAIAVDAVAFDEGGEPIVSYVRVDHDSDRDRPPELGGYGRVIDEAPRIEPRLLSPFGERYARFDGGARVLSGPSAIAIRGGQIWIALRSTDDVVALSPRSTGGLVDRRATFRVGRGPRGLAVSEDGRTAFVDLGYAHAVARLELTDAMRGPEGPVVEPALERTRPLGETRRSALALRGRMLFDDASDTHLTPSGVLTCATCHPGGGEDGLRWFLHTENVAPKLRRTPPAWAARPELSPFHWDGEFDDAERLTQTTIRELMEGDGLLVDAEAIAAWMAEAPIPPGRPVSGAADAAAVARGEEVFARAGCGDCHAGPLLGGAEAHDVAPPSSDDAARMTLVSTPPLRGVRARPPYLHDGRAPTLRSLFTEHDPDDRHGRTAALTDAELDDLVRYLETL